MSGISPGVLVSVGRTLLLASFAATLLQSIRGKHDLALPFERLVVGMLALSTFEIGAIVLQGLSDELAGMISALGSREDLRTTLLDSFRKAASSSGPGGASTRLNLPAILEQAWRTGVWGVMTSLVEGVFLISSFVLECAQEVLWKLLLFLFPLACGAYPVFPRMMTNLVLYAVELALWLPMLCLVEAVTGAVARGHLTQAGSLGLYLIGVEVIAIVLILMIPSVTHRFLSGAFAGDFDSQSGILDWAKRAIFAARTLGTGGAP